MVASELFSSLAAPVFAAMLFIFFLKRRSKEIEGGEANNNAAANDGTAGGDSGTHTSTEVPEVATSSGTNKDAAANDGTAGGNSGTHTSTEVPEMPTSSGANKDAAANDGTAGGDSGTHTSTEVPEMPPPLGYDYEVFLSFRGSDTRAGFTDHLYTRLKDAGIRTFKDDEDLRKGEEFAPELLHAIKQSKILIPIFSKDYASSVWCLKEVVQMVECKNNGGQKIIPIFYDVAPAEVRHQTGDYEKAFLSHESKKRYDQKTIGDWRAALRAVGEINGHDLQSMPNRREGKFVQTFTQKVFNELKKASLPVSDYLVSDDNQVDEIMKIIGAGTSETQIIGIHGMGGIGKTTIAKIIFNKLSHNFENCCFLSDIREMSKKYGIQHLQNQLISKILKTECMDIKDVDEGTQTIKDRLLNKQVLLLLDDVEERNHIKAFVGKRDWLGKGSKVILTTRNEDILEIPEVNCKYELSCMDNDQSLRLFSKHAFRRDSPLDEHIDQSKRAIDIAGGLPLTLEVIGSLLCGTKKEKWNLILKKLENVPHATVRSKLKISYDALDVQQQHIFLDIACFLIGYDKDILIHFWDESKYPEEAMQVLQNMSLIKIIKDNEVWMHDQLRDLGRDIVHQKSEMKIEKQSRVWDPKEASDLLRIRKGKTEVEALCLKLDNQWQYRFTYKGFESLSYLRFLEVGGSMENFCAEERLLWHESTSNVPSANENSDLLPQLRWLSWHGIPPTFKIANFSMENVAILDLSRSKITHDWQGWSQMEVMKNLKVLDLSYCRHLKRTPNFSAHSNLDRLILEGCASLTEIDRSICQLKRLVSLDVRNCENLQSLPDELGGDLASLKYLSLSGCESLERLPDTIGNLKSLIELDISDCQCLKRTPNFSAHSNLERLILSSCESLTEIDRSICHLKSLVSLDVSDCENLQRLPDEMGGDLASLEYLSLCGCRWLERLPDTIGNLESLIELDISFTLIKELPDSIGKLKNLKVVKMEYSDISKIPDVFWTIEKLEEIHVSARERCHVNIGNCISINQSLRILRLEDADICALPPRLPESLIDLQLRELCMDTFPDLSNLTNLKELDLGFSGHDYDGKSYGPVEDPIPRRMGNLSNLESLALCFDRETASPTDLSLPPQLKSLVLWRPKLRHLPRLPPSLSSLRLEDCDSLCSMEDLSNLKNLSSLRISGAAIAEVPGLGCLEDLTDMKLERLGHVKILPDLSNLNKLMSLCVWRCSNLAEIQGELPQSLEILEIYSCESLRKLLDLSSLKGLREVRISYCYSLAEIQGELPQSLEKLKIHYCKSLRKLPDLSSLKGLRKVEIEGCKKLDVEGDDAESESEDEGEDDESESEGDDAESESEDEGEDDESESRGEDEE
ncbi:disease resistance protein RPV1-like [Syzygium oleosum]|uniref:disease resistance protein RPV1-like n=1 Tax=Syzygium oleosum TaxID=219896 RepID=UPI0024BB3FF5|nr:disease resistance protein RPV1-like [Syzygium oleosum]XP_056172803.1 disease resistance protein RPV1-like [Syzygium oleosum]XP_056172805.1 disease resistance protein RPV1-like [Syzygium oleosum]XP_056172812.1 disease resistance protein RPV1-like [Syzygium oleosum]XP_056172814.1 disease resistance protein RPV1-like [Syzygium oleosum]XP_056172819.1 disease resistance protein RPV1-like [Syzygium oleosum]XP_056172825.1 disease resistance protein RPV1-like [Syzygium oleosum]XP_056172831.1 dis